MKKKKSQKPKKKLTATKKLQKPPKKTNKISPAKPKTIDGYNKIIEEDFLIAIDNVCKRLVYKFKFGYHDIEDIKQQATIFALEGLKNYDHKRPLENFLWTHIRNRLFNYKRNNYKRPDTPCQTCPLHDPGLKVSTSACQIHNDKENCELYRIWLDRNKNKQNLMTPTTLDDTLYSIPSHVDSVADNELLTYIELNLSGDFREHYLRLKNGEKLPKNKLEKLQEHIKDLMTTFNKGTENG